ncbi:aspartate ammonia-lyase [Caldanaerobacter subterraneus subsp. tengcongensis MB4]|uniref:Aspartate ammonia-lyase n=4 Tax=Caldanaerobacter subterraneus TaxID=911092 RepID=Q8RBK3_CALS4|nr:aspartate ammonia-lyase [Caldanaerobacter subterraneus]AAM24070.1 Aspartate ammonia-lyase [Caldanaerobacter subterraneus subsp. tengcongensis MB4]KKC30112.1 aspartate ammonia-lyase [Caldanaerobacter subterraneus subsp. pacificus DSM 12653]MCS3916408.1 aspartate ammonia-lyase [Caldanaerobacter subterraneus subsp. tengcongensis MB4]NNG65828.1 aspartate ammonia-lyase [Caldanaerobacter subterraneus]
MPRIEKDFLGELTLEDNELYGIHTKRALKNFSVSSQKIDIDLVRAIVMVKKACAIANFEVGNLDEKIKDAIVFACDEILAGKYTEQFVVDKFQGGAGTSTNMNVNEVIANIALIYLGKKPGEYQYIHPIDHVNMSQSTNDVYPTALRIATIWNVRELSEECAELQKSLQKKEHEFEGVIKAGRTQLQDALPITLGQEFGAYAQAISRDRWRIYKIEERLRVVNLGATAVGTGVNASLKYMFKVIELLRDFTKIGLARSDYLMDATQNADVFVECSGLLKALAVNLSKIANDLRLLSSGPNTGLNEINLPAAQAGSSIMPGKVNPVIPELINTISFQVMSNDVAITLAAQAGQLELNAFLPLIANNLLESLKILKNGIRIFRKQCIDGITANKERCLEFAKKTPSIAAALIDKIGYDKASEIAKKAIAENKEIIEVVKELKILNENEAEALLNPFEFVKFKE